jgi:hypothetical protein
LLIRYICIIWIGVVEEERSEVVVVIDFFVCFLKVFYLFNELGGGRFKKFKLFENSNIERHECSIEIHNNGTTKVQCELNYYYDI